jgi:hypothetical protein
MQVDLEKMLTKIQATQWSLADFDWNAPGAEQITPEQFPKLKAFMADLMWIEHVGARGFAAMAKKAPTETLRTIYRYYHAEEQRHANAEMALMRRWGMLDGDEVPEPSINIRLVIDWLDTCADDQPIEVLGSVIPMLEIALDGALVKFLLDEVQDPLCHAVFAKINADEARHLGVGFHVLEELGRGPLWKLGIEFAGRLLSPRLLLGILAYLPLLNRMRDNLVALGLEEEKLYGAIAKFERIGGTPQGKRNPWYQLISRHGRLVVQRRYRFYHVPVDALVKLSNHYPRRLVRPIPTWVRQITWNPQA